MSSISREDLSNAMKAAGLLRGRTALVTGAAGGIGQAIAVAFACSGARVVVADLTRERCQETLDLVAAVGGTGFGYGLDITDATAVQALASQVQETVGDVDTLVNNAGVIVRGGIDDPNAPANVRRAMDVNYFGCFNVIHAWLPSLRRTSGCIINVASGAAFVGLPGSLGYSPSKAAVKLLTQSLALELATDGIRVNALAPGVIETPMTADTRANPERVARFLQRIPSGRLGEPQELAGPAVFLASHLASYVNGVILPVDGGFLAV
jgi:meso-butanediol dehydrogenase / (S,S)-butanediol dehydrogenase / diacetyl reductase